MAKVASGVIFVWAGTHASIPAGWVRETTLDGKYPKGNADGSTNPNVTGGTATHEHTSSEHTHTMANHTHTINLAAATAPAHAWISQAGSIAPARYHDHPDFNSGNPSSVSVGNTAVTYAAVANDPPFYSVVFIKPQNAVSGLPDDSICFVDTADTLGFTFCNGSNDTPDLRNKYLKGAGTGADAGTTGGSVTNTHTIDHAHTVSHEHSSVNSPVTTTLVHGGYPNTGTSYKDHVHAVALPASTTATGTTSISLVTTETVEPAYTKLIPVQNKTGSVLISKGIIGMWLGTIASIPNGWELVSDMYGKHLKCANAISEAGDTGGSNTHTHGDQAHAHTNISHTHTQSSNYTHTSNAIGSGTGYAVEKEPATHAGAAISTDNYSLDNANTSAASSNNEPEYRTVAFIKLVSLSWDGAFLLNFV